MKKVLACMLSFVMACSMLLCVSAEDVMLIAAPEAPITLTVNGTAVECDVAPQLVDGNTLVPLRAAFEASGAVIILWDESTSTVHAQSPKGEGIGLQIGSRNLFIANEIYEMEVPAVIIGDRTMVPIRAIAEALDCDVEWVEETREVKITK